MDSSEISDRMLTRMAIGLAVVALLLICVVLPVAPEGFGLAKQSDQTDLTVQARTEIDRLTEQVATNRVDIRKLSQAQSRLNEQVFIIKRGPQGIKGDRGQRGPRGPQGTVDGVDLGALAERIGQVSTAQQAQSDQLEVLTRQVEALNTRVQALESGG